MPASEEDFHNLEEAFKNKNVSEIKQLLQNFDVTATTKHGNNCLLLSAGYSSSAMQLVFEKIEEVGGKALLQSQLAAANAMGMTCLMKACRWSSSPEVVKLIFEKIREAGGNEFLENQLSFKDEKSGWTCLMISSSSPEIVKLILENIVKASGPDLLFLKSQLEAKDVYDRNCLDNACRNNWSREVLQLLVSLLLCLDLFMDQYIKAGSAGWERLKDEAGIESSDWTPLSEPNEKMKIIFSDIKRIGALKEFLVEGIRPGETLLLSACQRNTSRERLEFFLNTIEEVGGEEFLAEQISKKREKDGMTCLLALCEFTPKYDSVSLLVSKIFQLESLGRRHLRAELSTNPYFERIFSRRFDSWEEQKLLWLLVMNLYSITGLFKEHWLRLDEEKLVKLSRTCGIGSSEWSRDWSSDWTWSTDVIGEIKKSIKNNI